MGRWRLGIGLAIAVVLLAATGTAQAKRRGAKVEVQRPNTFGAVSLGRRNGYRTNIFMGSQGVAILTLNRVEPRGEGGTVALAQYVVHTRGSLANGVVGGRFGSLGTFSLRFRPNGEVRDRGVPRGCEGPPTITEYGRFVGHVTFHGERRYLDFSARSGNGELARSFELICEKGRAYHLPSRRLRSYVLPESFLSTEGNIALLYASARSHGRYIGITVGHGEGAPPGAELRFAMFESRRAIAIGRYALTVAPPGTLLTSLPGEHPATATLAPPTPFYGEAHYRETSPHAGAWTGDLGIDFAGLKLPLTGPRFHVRLCVLNPLRHRKGCDFFKAEPEFDERAARPWWMSR